MDKNPTEKILKLIGCSKSEFARQMGVKPQHVHYWLAVGRIPRSRLIRAAEVSGIPVAELIA